MEGDARANSRPAPGPVLKVGDNWAFDSGLDITFLEVAADTRRYLPARPGRKREMRGNALVILRLEAGNQAPMTVRLNTHRDPDYIVIPANDFPPGVVGIPKSYIISIRELTPDVAPRGGPRAQRAYRLRLRVDVAV